MGASKFYVCVTHSLIDSQDEPRLVAGRPVCSVCEAGSAFICTLTPVIYHRIIVQIEFIFIVRDSRGYSKDHTLTIVSILGQIPIYLFIAQTRIFVRFEVVYTLLHPFDVEILIHDEIFVRIPHLQCINRS